TTQAHPLESEAIPAGALVYVGKAGETDRFVVRPEENLNNRWFWKEPTVPLTDAAWGATLERLPPEGFYTLPETLPLEGGGRWLQNALVQLGYNRSGQAIIFVAERRETREENALFFGSKGVRIDDALMSRLIWAPILPVPDAPDGPTRH
ncbi:MAG: hypothetical protein OEY14_17655, partial [Myxococcales bacterium]|nr:hypothetical protein [Myxococcales bacterium]